MYINRTLSECAISCLRPPIFSDVERDSMRIYIVVSCMFSVCAAGLVLMLWVMDRKKREQIFIVSNGVVVTVAFLCLSIFQSFGPHRLCSSNTVPIGTDGGLTLCSIEGGIRIYVMIFCNICYAIQAVELFRIIVLKDRSAPRRLVHLVTMFLVPLISFIVVITSGSIFNDPVRGVCRYQGALTYGEFIVFTAPLILSLGLTLVLTIGITVKLLVLLRTPPDQGGVPLWRGVRMAGTSIKFLLFSACYMMSLILVQTMIMNNKDDNVVILEWGRCALANFDGTPESYKFACGERVVLPVPFSTTCFGLIFSMAGFGFFYVLVNLEGLYALLKARLCGAKIDPIMDYVELAPSSSRPPNSLFEDKPYPILYENYSLSFQLPDFVGRSKPPSISRQISSLGGSFGESLADVEASSTLAYSVPAMTRGLSGDEQM
jgi:hypothetical protein